MLLPSFAGAGSHQAACADWMAPFFSNRTMKCRVTCYVAGQLFDVTCLARNYEEARRVALAQHPNARIIRVTAVS